MVVCPFLETGGFLGGIKNEARIFKTGEQLVLKNTTIETFENILSKSRDDIKIHGNSLKHPGPATVYELLDKDSGEILKIGETLKPDIRYSQKYLANNNAEMRVVSSKLSKAEARSQESNRITTFKSQNNGSRPKLNKNNR